MKRLLFGSIFTLVYFMVACQKDPDILPPEQILKATVSDEASTTSIDQANHSITIMIGPYLENAYRTNRLDLLVSASPNTFVEQVESLNSNTQQQGTYKISLPAYQNSQPLQLRVKHLKAGGTVAGIGGTIYTVQVKATGSLRIDKAFALDGMLLSGNVDTVRIGPGSNTLASTIFMGVSNLYNGSQPGTPKLYAVNVSTTERLPVKGLANEYTLDYLTVYMFDLFNRPAVYRILVETPDGRTTLSPFFVKIIPK